MTYTTLDTNVINDDYYICTHVCMCVHPYSCSKYEGAIQNETVIVPQVTVKHFTNVSTSGEYSKV